MADSPDKEAGSQTGKERSQKIVDELLNDDSLYEKQSEQEGKVWGRVFSDERRNQALKEDQRSATELRLSRKLIGLPPQLRKHGLSPVRGLSIACGGGRAERAFLDRGICQSFHGIDIAEAALQEAQEDAAKGNYNITYEQADLNKVELEKAGYDLVVAQNCLHHVLHLEHLADQIRDSIAPGGVLWIADYIGETQFQYDEQRMEIVNLIREILPHSYREDRVNQRTLGTLIRREPGTLISPFEAIRSAEIMPIFLDRFDVIECSETNALMDLICPVGTRHNYLQSEEGRSLFELLLLLDELLLNEDVLTPRSGCYLLRPKSLP